MRISLQETDWYTVYKHAVYDIYNLPYSFELKENKMSLTDRILKQYDYVLDDKTALWIKEEYKGREIIAQSYMSGVSGADNDTMKNSDIGSVWILSKLTQDKKFNENRIPYIRNFKILQQSQDGFFKGAVEGQYYLAKVKRFTEEWGNHFEPVAITYYTMADLGNIFLFEPDNDEIKKLLRNGAERLLEWQQQDGSWAVAYDRTTLKPIYTDLKDYHPTFYGLIIADQIFKDEKYLNAAIETAKMYTTSIYTHPIPSRGIKTLNGKEVEDWQLSQIGLGFEHGDSMESAVNAGPILLASHCAYFLKLYEITKDNIFRDMARLGALGKDSFVNEETGVAFYYWNRFDFESGSFPHHAWWQIGWIYDYLLAEAELRSEGKIKYPRGFMTPKVGTHKTVGFTTGAIDGESVDLVLRKGLVNIDNPNVDYITALNSDNTCLYVIFLNNQQKKQV